MKYIGPMLRRCSLPKCEAQAEFLSEVGNHAYCERHARFLAVGGQLLIEEEELREKEHVERLMGQDEEELLKEKGKGEPT